MYLKESEKWKGNFFDTNKGRQSLLGHAIFSSLAFRGKWQHFLLFLRSVFLGRKRQWEGGREPVR
jgi:hypothetical protein